MNLTLGTGKAVHANYSTDGAYITECGTGDRPGQRLKTTTAEVSCKRCIKILAQRAEWESKTAYYAGVAETQDDVMSQAQPLTEQPGAPVVEGNELTEGSAVEAVEAIDYSQTSGRRVRIDAGTPGTVIEVHKGRTTEYLVRFERLGGHYVWAYGSEIRPRR